MINGGLSDEQIAERVVDYDDDEYGFVRMVRTALLEAGVLKEEIPLGKLHALAPPKGRRKNPFLFVLQNCLLYTSPSPRDAHESRMPSSA